MSTGVFDESFPQQFYPMMPGNREVTLTKKTTRATTGESDTFAAGVEVDARKRTVSRKEQMTAQIALTTPTAMFTVWTDGSRANFVAPENEDTITDDDGTRYTVLHTNEIILGTAWDCICTKKWDQEE